MYDLDDLVVREALGPNRRSGNYLAWMTEEVRQRWAAFVPEGRLADFLRGCRHPTFQHFLQDASQRSPKIYPPTSNYRGVGTESHLPRPVIDPQEKNTSDMGYERRARQRFGMLNQPQSVLINDIDRLADPSLAVVLRVQICCSCNLILSHGSA